ncbi:MAG: HAD-IG family 5'-nucleotidase [Planctomycetota bacterium]
MQPIARDFEAAPGRRVFCNRTLNMRAIQAIGFDMDYTLVHYDVHQWEARAYAHVQNKLLARGLPVQDLRFDPDLFTRGLIVDVQTGNVVKANRFGYVVRASHGTRLLAHDEQRAVYSQVWVDLRDPRWMFLNTLFSLSEACLYGQLVDLMDAGRIPRTGYDACYELVRDTIDAAHLEGELKAEIIADPERFVELDPLLPRALLDLQQAGKRLFLATNSEWHYTMPMMEYTFDRYLGGGSWRDLFELIVVQSRKPSFFDGNAEFVEVLDDSGRESPGPVPLRKGARFRGGNAQLVQDWLGIGGESILYVGDHVYADVHVSSRIRRWRTALVLRELEEEIAAEHAFVEDQRTLVLMMQQKERLEREQCLLRLALARHEHGAPPPPELPADATTQSMQERLRVLRQEGEALDVGIGPLAARASGLTNERWGPLMRAGNDKSQLARQIEGHADIYTSRVSNLLHLTPFGYLRAARGSLPHDPRA